mmetsp:Transcript_32663/g.32032  ORF Transcript_32663/g.32032 Transcript_32663/m.32032 type:complete len:82 (+) Transcript_32663:15-260(+)
MIATLKNVKVICCECQMETDTQSCCPFKPRLESILCLMDSSLSDESVQHQRKPKEVLENNSEDIVGEELKIGFDEEAPNYS